MNSDRTDENIKRARMKAGLTQTKQVDESGQETDLIEKIFDRGFRAGYLSARDEMLEKMETWLGVNVKRDGGNGSKDHKETS